MRTRYPNHLAIAEAPTQNLCAAAVRWLKGWGFDARMRRGEPKVVFVEPRQARAAQEILLRDNKFLKKEI